MIYTANITTPKNTALKALLKTTIFVTKGLAYKIQITFPAGSAGLMGVAIFDGLYQVWPSSVGEFFVGEDHVIAFDDLFLKEEAPFELQCYSYNLDDTYDHDVSVHIGLVSKEVFLARYLPTREMQYLTKLIEQMAEEKKRMANWQRKYLPATPFQWMLEGKGKV